MDRKKDSYVPNMIQYYRKRDLIHRRPVVGFAWMEPSADEAIQEHVYSALQYLDDFVRASV